MPSNFHPKEPNFISSDIVKKHVFKKVPPSHVGRTWHPQVLIVFIIKTYYVSNPPHLPSPFEESLRENEIQTSGETVFGGFHEIRLYKVNVCVLVKIGLLFILNRR